MLQCIKSVFFTKIWKVSCPGLYLFTIDVVKIYVNVIYLIEHLVSSSAFSSWAIFGQTSASDTFGLPQRSFLPRCFLVRQVSFHGVAVVMAATHPPFIPWNVKNSKISNSALL